MSRRYILAFEMRLLLLCVALSFILHDATAAGVTVVDGVSLTREFGECKKGENAFANQCLLYGPFIELHPYLNLTRIEISGNDFGDKLSDGDFDLRFGVAYAYKPPIVAGAVSSFSTRVSIHVTTHLLSFKKDEVDIRVGKPQLHDTWLVTTGEDAAKAAMQELAASMVPARLDKDKVIIRVTRE